MKSNDKFILIEYIDSNLIHEQTDFIAEPAPMKAIGFLIKETDEFITLAMELTGSDEYRGQLSVPKIAIKKKTSLKK